MTDPQLPKYLINVRRLPALGVVIKLAATDAEIKVLTRHLDVLELADFSAQLKFRPWAKAPESEGVQVEGDVTASLQTQCPLTLKPVPQNIHASFNAKFVPATSKLAKPRLNDDGELVLDIDCDDIPDTYEGEELDAWAIAVEYLLLEIDPFARAEAAEFVHIKTQEAADEGKTSPFAMLQSLKK